MAEGVQKLESTILHVYIGQTCKTPPGSESMACNQRKQVNVGDPDSPSSKGVYGNTWKYWLTSLTSEEAEMAVGKSDGS